MRSLLTWEFVTTYAEVVFVDGSFVSDKKEPGDVDIIIGLRAGTISAILNGALGDGRSILHKLQGRLTEQLPGVKHAVQAKVDDVEGPLFVEYRSYFQESTRTTEPPTKGILVLRIQ